MYEVFLTREAQCFYEQADPVLVRKLNRCFQSLRKNPHEHPSIKRLKGSLAGHFAIKWEIGEWSTELMGRSARLLCCSLLTEARLTDSAFIGWIGSGIWSRVQGREAVMSDE